MPWMCADTTVVPGCMRYIHFMQVAVWTTPVNIYCNCSEERKSSLRGPIIPVCIEEDLIEKIRFKVDLGKFLV